MCVCWSLTERVSSDCSLTFFLVISCEQNNFVAEKQAKEARDKEDADLQNRAAKRERQRQAIEQSRQEQLAARKHLQEREAQEQAERFALQTEKIKLMENAEFEKRAASMARARDYRTSVEAQAAEKVSIREAQREASLREDAQTKIVLGEDEVRFRRIAQAALDDAVAEGKNPVPIQKAMYAKTITLLPASVSMRL